MGLLNLALGQLLGLFLPVAGLLVALYFYDRSRRRVLVSTLRFWPHRPAPAVRQRHKRIQHPLSLLLQLAAVLLLLLAIADPRPGGSGTAARHRVVVLDTSAAMALPGEEGGSLMDEAKTLALRYLDRISGSDRVLLIEADGAPAVRVPFTQDRHRVREAILSAEPAWTALDLQAALDLAEGTLRLALDLDSESSRDPVSAGEAVYVGPGIVSGPTPRPGRLLAVRFLETDAPTDTLGLLALRASADPAEPGKWDVELSARNYSSDALTARIDFLFDGRQLGHRSLALAPATDDGIRFTLRTSRPGLLTARAAGPDAYPANNEAGIRIPAVRRTRLQVIGGSEDAFGALLASGAHVEPSFVRSGSDLAEDAIHLWARGGVEGRSRRAIYLSPPGTDTPIGEAGSVRGRPLEEWSASHPLAQGVRDPDMTPDRARIFRSRTGDQTVAGTSEGPVIVAREAGDSRLVVFGFDLAAESVRNRLATPLLFANAVAWLDSGAFRSESVEARSPGAIEIEAPNSARGDIAVRTLDGGAVPWVLEGDSVRFFAGRRGTYRVATADRDVTLYLNQPEVPATAWEPPDEVLRGLPSAVSGGGQPILPWPWLAAVAALILLYDWIRFGRGRRLGADPFQAAGAGPGRAP